MYQSTPYNWSIVYSYAYISSAPQPPANVRVGSIQGCSINVTWSSVAGASQYMVCIYSFTYQLLNSVWPFDCFQQVYYRPDKSYQVTDPSYNSSEQSVRTVSTQVTLSGLYPASTYTVYIRSVNAVSTGAASTPVTVVLPPAGQEWESEEGKSHSLCNVFYFFHSSRLSAHDNCFNHSRYSAQPSETIKH